MAGEKVIKLSAREVIALESLAQRLGALWGGHGSITRLMREIAEGNFVVLDISSDALIALNWSATDAGYRDTQDALISLCAGSGFIAGPIVESRLNEAGVPSQWFWHHLMKGKISIAYQDQPSHPTIQSYLDKKQPFRIQYMDAAGRSSGFTVLGGSLQGRWYAPGKKRIYLDCVCTQGAESGSAEIPELSHNWSLRLDQVNGAVIVPVDAPWESRTQICVEFCLTGSLAWSYEGHPDDLTDTGSGDRRIIARNIDSTFWFFREFLPYLDSAEILSPSVVRAKFTESIANIVDLYSKL